ncbi:MAG: XdhC family protein [Alphaproteobacteria bacterium]|nr:XdhC family protein [Alphaproteobacteria bacterium]MBV9552229.1 XdhC family protein [Alphaproteobacteria bacterium]
MKRGYIEAVLAANNEGRSVALATELRSGAQLFLDGDQVEGDLALDDGSVATMREALRADRNISLDMAEGRVFVQVFSPPRRCLVVGAVHIAQPLVPMLIAADYRPIVIDPRGAWATEARFPGVELSTEWPDEAFERLKPDRSTAVVTLTHDPKIDDPALVAALRSDAFYIGALGSKRNHARRLERLAAEHGFGENELARIHGPIGLDIGAVSQAEIAISIMGEMTSVLRRGSL